MKKARPPQSSLEAMEAAISEERGVVHCFRLYLAGPTPQSTRALVNIRKFCENHLPGRYELEVLDLLRHPQLAQTDQVIAAPTLARISPLPVRRFIGDLSQTDRILKGLGLTVVPPATPENL